MHASETKRVRLIDVATKARVSRIVAGHVLLGSGGKTTRVSPATADRVRAAASELDYRPNLIARQLRGARTKTLATLIDANRYTIHYERMRAIDRVADRRGYRLMVSYLHRDKEQVADELLKQLDEMIGRGVEGVILIRGLMDWPDRIVSRLEQMNLVVCNIQPALSRACRVTVDLTDGIEQLVEHLVQTGRKRPAMMLAKRNPPKTNPRISAFTAACKKFHLGDKPTFWTPDLETDPTNSQTVRPHVDRLIDEYLKAGSCDAILASNDLWGVQVIKSLLKRGIRVPEDIAVTGIDNVEIAAASNPELTTIDQCNDEFAKHVMDLMGQMIEGKSISKANRHIKIKPQLVIREST